MTAASAARLQRTACGDAVWLFLALCLAAALRLWSVTNASLYSDEAFTLAVSSLPPPALLHALALHDFHPPLFYLVTHALLGIVRWSFPQYRYLSAAAGLLTVLATWGFTRRYFGPLAAAASAFIVALAPALLQYDRLYRMHAFTVALGALAWWILAELDSGPGRKRPWLWLGYGALAVALPYTEYLGALVLTVQAAFAVSRWRTLAPALGCIVLGAIAFIPWLHALREQFPLGGLALSRPAFDSGLFASVRGAFAPGVPDALRSLPFFDVGVTLLVLALLGAGVLLGRRSALPYWLALLPLQVVVSLLLGKNIAYFPRYLLATVPALAIAAGATIAALGQRRKFVAAGAALSLLVPLAGMASNQLFDPYYQFPDWHAVAGILQANAQPGDVIVLDEAYEYLVVRNYRAFRTHAIVRFMNPHDFAPVLQYLTAHPQQRVWYIEHQNFYWDPQRRIAASLAQRRKQLLRWDEHRQSPVDAVSVALYDRIPMTRLR